MQVARTVLADLDLDAVLERVIASARELTGARYVAIEPPAEAEPRPAEAGSRRGDRTLTVPIVIGGAPYKELQLAHKETGEPFTEADEQAVSLLAELAALAIDHARRFGGTETRRLELQRTVDALEATMEIARAVAGRSDLEAVLGLVAKRGRALVSARILAIEVQEGADLVIAAGAGEIPPNFLGLRFSAAGTVASVAVRTHETQRLSDPANWAGFHEHGLGGHLAEIEDGLVVPMIFHGESYGVLVALDRFGGPAFEPEHRRLLESFAASAAIVVATARGAADERRRQVIAAAEAERGRWARELHDDTLQALASVRLMLGAARRLDEPDEMRAAIEQAVEELKTNTENLRALIADLRPGSLDQLGVEPAIADLAERFEGTGIELDCHLDFAYDHGRESRRLAPELETAIYRTVQETLNNVAKHSGARRAMVEAIESGDAVSIRVRDDGRGFDPAAHTPGFGLLGMRERVELVEGELTVDSEPGRGTTITARFPVRRRGGA